MKKIYTILFCLTHFMFLGVAQNVGVGEVAPGSKLSVKGNLSVGNSYSNISTSLPVNGLIVEGSVGIGTPNPSAQLHTTGSVRLQNLGGGGNRYVRTDNNGLLSTTATVPWSDITGAPAIVSTEVDPTWNGAANETGNVGRTGNVGFGTTAPSSKIDVVGGSVRLPASGYEGAGQIQSTGIVRFANAGSAQAIYTKQISASASWADNDTYTQTNGIYSSGNFRAGGATLALFANTSNGNVGVGTVNPSSRLHVLGSSATARIEKPAHAPGASDFHLELFSPDSGDPNNETSIRFHQGNQVWGQIRFRANGFRFTSGSNDGLTPIAAASIFADGNATITSLGGGGNRYVRSDNNGLLSTTATVPWSDITGVPAIVSTEVDPTWNGAANTTGNVGRTGNVGIGTLSPSSRLHLLGNSGILNLEGADHGYIQWFPQGIGAGRRAWTGFGSAATTIFTIANENNDAPIVLSPTGINGRVGIATTSPSAKLDVVGPATGSGVTIRASGGGDVLLNSGGSLFFDGNYSYGSGNYIRPVAANTQVFVTSGAERLRIASNGNIGIANSAPSERLHVSGNVLASGIVYWGSSGTRTETRSDAGLQGNAGARSGFYETSAPSPASNWPVGASSWWHLLDIRHSNNTNNYALQFSGSFFNQDLFFRKTNNNPATPWSKIATVENTLGSNIQSVTSNTDVSTISSSFTAIPDMTITFTPIHPVVYVTFSASGNHTGTISAAQFAHFRIVKDGVVIKGTSSPVGEFDDFDGGHNVWDVNFTYPVAVTPGVPTTIRVDWAYFRRFTSQTLWIRPSVEPVAHHRHLMILD